MKKVLLLVVLLFYSFSSLALTNNEASTLAHKEAKSICSDYKVINELKDFSKDTKNQPQWEVSRLGSGRYMITVWATYPVIELYFECNANTFSTKDNNENDNKWLGKKGNENIYCLGWTQGLTKEIRAAERGPISVEGEWYQNTCYKGERQISFEEFCYVEYKRKGKFRSNCDEKELQEEILARVLQESNENKTNEEEGKKTKEEDQKQIAEADKKEEQAKQPQEEELYVIGSGTGFFVNDEGYVVTNEHVAGICQSLASYINGKTHIFNILALDNRNDLALLRGEYRNKNFLNINPLGAEFGQDIMAFGFPLAENLSSSVKLTRGIVSSLSGPENDISLIQIDAAIQPGNSGGPVLNYNGQVVGVASSGLNKVQMLLDEESPYIPENVNFAVAATTLTGFLKSNSVKIFNESFDQKSSQELAKIGMPPTIQLHCLNTIAAHNQLRESENYNDVLLKKVVNLK